nr:sigma-70 family RNA polymerase sigma factor [Bacteroides sp.]
MNPVSNDNFRSLVMPHAAMMLAVCERILGPEDAPDALQEALLKLWQACDALEAAANQGAYCRMAARNAAISRLRSASAALPLDAAAGVGDDLTVCQLDDASSLGLVEELIDRLPPVQRSVLRLRSFDGLDVSEIASRLGLSEANVRQHLSRARRTLKHLYSLHNR